MSVQPNYQRLLTTIRLQEPDRVPLTELSIDKPVKEQFLGHPVRGLEGEVASIAHKAGMPFILHSDGKLWQIVDDLLVLGLDALHPIEPKAMDINAVQERYGNRLALLGNIDLGYTLTRGTPDEVQAEVRRRIRDLAPGGDHAVGSSNSFTHYVPLENFNAMREATLDYGMYPIRL